MKIKKFNEHSSINEGRIDDDIKSKIMGTEAYKELSEEFKSSIDKFEQKISEISDELGYDEGDTDHNYAFSSSLQEALDENYGY